MKFNHFEKVQWRFPRHVKTFIRHMLVIGKSGSGKSNVLEWLGTQMIGKQKVIDLVDRGRFENMTYSLPEDKPDLVNKIRTLTKGMFKPTGFANDIYLVCGKRLKYLKTLPRNVQVVSLDTKDIDLNLMFHLLGNTPAGENLLGYISYEYGNLNLDELEDFLKNKADRDENIHKGAKWNILRNISRWKQSGMFNPVFEKLDIEKIFGDVDTITSFGSYFLENEEEEAIFYSVLLRKILDSKRKQLIPHKILVMIREISYFMGKQSGKNMDLAQRTILKIIREGRDLGITLYCDTQLLRDLDTRFRRQFGFTICLKCDRGDAESLKEIIDIPARVLYKLPKMDRGVAIMIVGGDFFYPMFFPPALNWHKSETTNVFEILKNHYGEYNVNQSVEFIAPIKRIPEVQLDPVSKAVIDFLKDAKTWEGKVSELYAELEKVIPDQLTDETRLGKHLNTIKEVLVERWRFEDARMMRLTLK